MFAVTLVVGTVSHVNVNWLVACAVARIHAELHALNESGELETITVFDAVTPDTVTDCVPLFHPEDDNVAVIDVIGKRAISKTPDAILDADNCGIRACVNWSLVICVADNESASTPFFACLFA